MVREAQHRLVLFLNHVLMQESEAQARLRRQKGRVLLLKWRQLEVLLVATPAGLLDLASPGIVPDLSLSITETSPLELARAALRGDKPPVAIEGDVQLAADIGWLVDHVRWDVEEDLSRLLGDAAVHQVAQAAARVAAQLREFVASRVPERKPPA